MIELPKHKIKDLIQSKLKEDNPNSQVSFSHRKVYDNNGCCVPSQTTLSCSSVGRNIGYAKIYYSVIVVY
ncbi:hypothetical protein RIR_jg25070.t1 [Rhizophagus irregularis DAOM 181602=DAOM 197198]|uniref:Uncharacterized protein n=1 Tax=Rhizophagus irregularis (strain DAOM 181602 / DAOM 197198 / MUCL 43194) TaxID=747089 RepID=U9UNL3_RHIID|nr:hypothetical protein RIR_jg25070.t1 [Rhizophagus irregularis DAOM 181602=DAOM 197198]